MRFGNADSPKDILFTAFLPIFLFAEISRVGAFARAIAKRGLRERLLRAGGFFEEILINWRSRLFHYPFQA